MSESRPCPVCHSGVDKATLLYEKNIDPVRLSSFSFSSRKEPEYMCHRLMRCTVCDLVYADQPPEESELEHAYHTADFDSSQEANDAAAAYIRAIYPALEALPERRSVLEIGTGTGVFLDHLSHQGFTNLTGVEPSAAAITAAPQHRKAWIREGMFDEKNFAPESFDLICCFMTMEHVRDPAMTAQSSLRLLRPGGAFVTVTHDYRGLVNRMLGRRSPIIDIEHLQLFSKTSAKHLFERAGYANVSSKGFANSYTLRYWMRLAPIPLNVKPVITRLIAYLHLDRTYLTVNVGNIITYGFKHV